MSTKIRSTTRTPSPRRGILTGTGLAALLAAAHLATDTVAGTFAGLLPVIQARFGLAETALAGLVAALALGTSISQPVFGALADRLGRRGVAALGAVLSASLLSLVPIAPTVALLFALLLVGGLGSAAFHPAAAGIARAAGERNRALAVGLFSAGGTLGVALGPVLVLLLIATFGLGAAPWLMVPGVLLGLLVFALVPPQAHCASDGCPKLVDLQLFVGPVGWLALVGILIDLAYVSFTSALPLWLVAARGVARDSTLIGWTLAAFSLAAALGGVAAGVLSARLSRRLVVTGSLLLAPAPLFAIFRLEPGSPPFFLAVLLAGALVNGSLPLLIVSAQDFTPRAVATASGLLMGFTLGVAGLLYIGLGRLQESLGLEPALGLSYLVLLPAAVLAFGVLTERRVSAAPDARAAVAAAFAGGPCLCTNAYAAGLAADATLGEVRTGGPACTCPPSRSSCYHRNVSSRPSSAPGPRSRPIG